MHINEKKLNSMYFRITGRIKSTVQNLYIKYHKAPKRDFFSYHMSKDNFIKIFMMLLTGKGLTVISENGKRRSDDEATAESSEDDKVRIP